MKDFFHKIKSQLEGYDFFDTLKHTSTYFSATILINLLGLVSLPVYTNFLSTAEFGIVEAFNNFVKVLAVLMTFNTHQAVGRYYFEQMADWKEFIGTSLFATIIVFIFSSSIFIFFQDEIIGLLNIPKDLFVWFFPATISIAILALFNQLFVSKKNSLLVSKGQLVFAYGRFFGALLCILFWMVPYYYGRVVGDVIVMSLVSIFLFYKISPNVRWVFNIEHLKYNLKFSLPLIPYSISGFILHFFDLFMINGESNSDAGVYAFAYKIGFLFLGLDQALHNASKPDFYKWMNNNDFNYLDGQIKSMLKIHTIGAVFLIFFSNEIGSVLASDDAFTDALNLVPVIVIGYVFFTSYNFYARLLFYSKKTYIISFLTVTVGIVNIILNAKYIPEYGYEAAAFTTLFSFVLMLMLGYAFTVRLLKLPPPPIKTILSRILLIIVMLLLFYFVEELYLLNFISRLILKVSVFALLSLFLFGRKLLKLKEK